jgi:hypothetical protein
MIGEQINQEKEDQANIVKVHREDGKRHTVPMVIMVKPVIDA